MLNHPHPPSLNRDAPSSWRLVWLAAGYTLLIVYGSLIPLVFEPRPFAEAWSEFRQLPYLQLGAGKRADLMANFLLFVPIGFLWTAVVAGPGSNLTRLAAGLAVWLGCLPLVLGLEFVQVYTPRTVSQNDVFAELLGAAAGVLLWAAGGPLWASLAARARSKSRQSLHAALVLYLVAYVIYGLAPFDFVISHRELEAKLAAGGLQWWNSHGETGLRWLAILTLEILAAAPLGLLAAMSLGKAEPRHAALYGCAVGAAFGLAIETLQIFLVSGSSTGLSILTRGVGGLLGGALPAVLKSLDLQRLRVHAKPALGVIAPLYFMLAAALRGWRLQWPLSISEMLDRAEETSFLPFYYHYYSPEMIAIQSIALNAALYAPVGMLVWSAMALARWRPRFRHRLAGAAGAAVGTVIELGRLAIGPHELEPTNVLIAAMAAALGFAFCDKLRRWIKQFAAAPPADGGVSTPRRDAPDLVIRRPHPPRKKSHKPLLRPGHLWRGLALVCFVLAAVLAACYPLGRWWLVSGLLAYAGLLIVRPEAWLVALPAGIVALDGSPWSGWFMVDALDALLLVTLAVGYWRAPTVEPALFWERLPAMALGLLAASCAASLVIGLFPLPPFDVNSLASYHSRYNALRVFKGFLWAAALLPLLRRASPANGGPFRQFSLGMQLGLFLVGAWIVAERARFVGVFNLSEEFRATGPFFSMHVGGQHLDAYLALALPFAFVPAFPQHPGRSTAWSIAVFTLAAYAVLATGSRGAIGAAAVVLAFMGVAWLLRRGSPAPARQRGAWIVAVAAVAGLMIAPALASRPLRTRFVHSERDLLSRIAEWRQALAIRPDGAASRLLGAGLGSFPRLRARGAGAPPNAPLQPFQYRWENDNGFVRLKADQGLYLGQLLAIHPRQTYRVSVDLRSTTPGAGATFLLCEKSALYSFHSVAAPIAVRAAGVWERHVLTLDSADVGAPPPAGSGRLGRRPTALSFAATAPGTIDLDNLQLLDAGGRDLVRNGDFSRGHDYWFFTSDNHPAWRVFNLGVYLLFEQGWLGVLSVGFVILTALARLALLWQLGDVRPVVLTGAILGFLLVGLFGSLLDTPRLALLFYCVMLLALTLQTQPLLGTAEGSSERGAEFSWHAFNPLRLAGAGAASGKANQQGPHRV